MITAKPSSFTEGQLLDDFDGKILEAGTDWFDYNGTREAVPALRLVIGHGDNFSEIYIQHYTAGDVKNFHPTGGDESFESPHGVGPNDDAGHPTPKLIGLGFDAVGDKQFLGKSSNTGMLLSSVVSAGLPEDRLESGNYKEALTGLVCHFMRQVVPEKPGSHKGTPEKGKANTRLQTVLLVSEIKAGLDGQPAAPTTTAKTTAVAAKPKPAAPVAPVAKPAPAKPTAPTATTTAPAPSAPAAGALDPADYDEALQQLVLAELTKTAEDGETLVYAAGLKKGGLIPIAFNGITKDAKFRTFATKRVMDPAFLSSGPWTYENGVLSLG